MLDTKQRLVGLHVLSKIYAQENVATTPFYKLMLDLLENSELLHVAEQSLLAEFVKSVPKISKLTPSEYIAQVEAAPPPNLQLDLEPYRKSQKLNMPKTNELNSSSLLPLLPDEDNKSSSYLSILMSIETHKYSFH